MQNCCDCGKNFEPPAQRFPPPMCEDCFVKYHADPEDHPLDLLTGKRPGYVRIVDRNDHAQGAGFKMDETEPGAQ